MECQDCGTEMRVKRTYPSGTDKVPTTTRVHECGCGSRFLSEETITRRLPSVAISSPPVARRRASGTPPNGVLQAAGGSETARLCDSSIPKGGLGVSVSGSELPPDPSPVVVDPTIRAREPAATPQQRFNHGAANTQAFMRVYSRYPNKVGKNVASQVFRDLAEVHDGGEEALSAAITGSFDRGMLKQRPYFDEKEGVRFCPALERFLERRLWEDDQSASVPTAEGSSPYGKIPPLKQGVPPPPRPRP